MTDFIPQIVTFVSSLVKQGYAYPVADGKLIIYTNCAHDRKYVIICSYVGSVYFDTGKYQRYGKLRKVEEIAQFEVEEGQGKKNKQDFAVWKGWKPGEPFWTSPWGKGRPGWHIECSAMARSTIYD